MAVGANVRAAVIAESAYGTTPDTPAFQTKRYTQNTLAMTRDMSPSGELGREVKYVSDGPRKCAGNLVGELSYGSYDYEIQCVLGAAWAAKATITASTLSAAASDNSFSDSGNGFVTAGFEVGDIIEVTGFTGDTPSANNASFIITAVTAGKITIGGTDGDVIVDDTAGEEVTIVTTTQRTKVGTTKFSFTSERYHSDISDKPYHRFTGTEIDSLALSLTGEGDKIEVTFAAMAKDIVTAAGAISGSSYLAPTTTELMNAFSGTLKEGGSEIGVISEISLNIANSLAGRFPVGAGGTTIQHSRGKCIVTGSITAWFEDNDLYDKFLNKTDSSLDITLVDDAGNKYRVYLPNLRYTSGPIEVSEDGEITVAMDFHGKYDSTVGSTIAIDRTPA